MTLDPRELRNALGRFATGICVITANPEGKEPFGMTVNSFASVSLDPPLLLWSLQNDSECFADFEAADRFGVNILSQDQAAISTQYARKSEHTLDAEHYRLGPNGCPILNGALTSFECDKWQTYDGGDHAILVGKVLAMESLAEGRPLLFFSGQYGELR